MDEVNEVDRVLHLVATGDLGQPFYMAWGVHAGIEGASWTRIQADGLITRQSLTHGQDVKSRPVGRVAPHEVQDLADVMSAYGISAPEVGPPSNPGRCESLDLVGGGVSYQVLMDPAEVDGRGDLSDIRSRFELLEGRAKAAARVSRAQNPPLEIEVSPLFWATVFGLGLITCGIGALWMLNLLRTFPRRFDQSGVVLRDGRAFAWDELSIRPRVDVSRGTTLGYDLIASDGTAVRIAPGGIKNPAAVFERLQRRLS